MEELFELFGVEEFDPLNDYSDLDIELDNNQYFDEAEEFNNIWDEETNIESFEDFGDGLEDIFLDNDDSLESDDLNVFDELELDFDNAINSICDKFEDIFDFFSEIIDDIFNISPSEGVDCETLRADDFSNQGTYDLKNNVFVEGNVVNDMQFVDLQTHGSCSLMAQEQFVNRYLGQSIPEEYLEWAANKWGVYSPDLGTDVNGQSMVLDHFNIPHGEHEFNCEIADLNNAISNNEDIIIGVDARDFYEDMGIPPDSGHAVAVVGRGINPVTNEISGYYITDSNYPQSVHFVSVDKLERAWQGDMITVPEKITA